MKACWNSTVDSIDCSGLWTMMGTAKSCAADTVAKTAAESSKSPEWAMVKEMLALPIEDCRTSAVGDEEGGIDVPRNLWSYYRGATGCIVVNWKYQAAYKELKMDPLWPYLRACPGVNDESRSKGVGNAKRMVQVRSQGEAYTSLAKKATEAQPALLQICKAIAKKLKLTKVGVGPIKDEDAARAKAKRKYGGNLCNITDYCRVFLVVDDMATLLALIEYVCQNFPSSICRIKLSTLCGDSPHPGGYRDCKINLMVKGHICEIQVHLRALYDISAVDGYQHYKDWLLNDLGNYMNENDDLDPSSLLNGLDQKMLGDIADIAEETTKITTVTGVARDDEEKIVDFIAVAGLLLRHEESFKAEVICRHLINLRCQWPSVEPNHPEIIYLKKKLVTALRQQNLMEEADSIAKQLRRDMRENYEGNDGDTDSVSLASSFFGVFGSSTKSNNSKLDSKEVERSERTWVKLRQERFVNIASCMTAQEALAEVNNILKNPEAGRPNSGVTTLTTHVTVASDDTTRSSDTGVVGESGASNDAAYTEKVGLLKIGLRGKRMWLA